MEARSVDDALELFDVLMTTELMSRLTVGEFALPDLGGRTYRVLRDPDAADE